MQLNETTTDEIRQETFRGRDYLVAPVRAMMAMNLDGGYVPAAEVERSVAAWNGTPVTLYHPRTAEGELTSANSPDIAEKTWLGFYFNAQYTPADTALDGEVWVDVDHAETVGGAAETVLNSLRNEEPVPVSTAYFGDEFEPGEYDGEQREAVIGNIRPDHLAMLPGKDGKCSVADGCMAGSPAPVATNCNADVWAATNAPAFANVDADGAESAQTPDGGASGTDDPGNAGEVSGNVLSGTDGSDSGSDAGSSPSNADSTRDNTMERDDKIAVLVNEYGFTQESLEGMGDSCLDRTYDSFANDGSDDSDEDDDGGAQAGGDDTGTPDDGGTSPDTSDSDGTDSDAETVTMEKDELAELIDQRVEQGVEARLDDAVDEALAANEREKRTSELVKEITANSDEYDEEALANTPPEVLENIRDDVVADVGAANFAAQRGAGAQPATNDADELPALSASARIAEKESDD